MMLILNLYMRTNALGTKNQFYDVTLPPNAILIYNRDHNSSQNYIYFSNRKFYYSFFVNSIHVFTNEITCFY